MLVTVYAPADVYAVDLAAVCDVLAAANQATRKKPRYTVRIVAEAAGLVCAFSGVAIRPDATIPDAEEACDLLIVCPGASWRKQPEAPVLAWLQRQAAGAERFGAIGNGVFLLGMAGLLGESRVTTHWHCSDDLRRDFPAVQLEPDRIFVRDRRLFSSAGGVATFDLMLDLIEEDHGRELALELARRFILFMKRSGAQAQLSVSLSTQSTTRDPIQRAQQHVIDNPTADLSVTALAGIAAMSPRNFARVFHQETGMRPTDFVEQIRVNLARRMIDESALSPQQVARMCGFSGTEAARRAFHRRTGTTMSGYRAGRKPADG